ncbi:MAG: N-methyl-L-tryptophan oxidase [Bradyrhizobiaceae bacterium]|nr:N-methyl-L-tryptophan oxidase [Bradyrhizobiaceae bacterium]
MAAFDVVVVGLGAMGSAALYHLARRGRRVVGIERFYPGHDRGSSHGETRIIRLGYFEHPSYVPLVRAALQLWRELEARSGRKLLDITGVIEIGAPNSVLIKGTLDASRQHALTHDVLDAATLMRRFPAFRVPPEFVGALQPNGGFLMAEAAIHTLVGLAEAAGAQIRLGETVREVKSRAGSARVETDRGSIDADTVVIAAGAWARSLLPALPILRITRQVLAWFAPLDGALFVRDRFPVFLLESPRGMHYGFPLFRNSGLKIAKHHHLDETVDPDDYSRTLSTEDEAAIRDAIADYLPAANGPLLSAKTCLYTMTSDGDFIVDRMPGEPQIVIASPCSGHGFKFAPVLGAAVADLATVGTTSYDISRFRMNRFIPASMSR